MYTKLTPTEFSALEVLRQTGVCPLKAAIIADTFLRANRNSIKNATACLQLGLEAMKNKGRTVIFSHCVSEALSERKTLRPRTLADMRYISQKLMQSNPGLPQKHVHAISAADCERFVCTAFSHARQRVKARLILSSIFATALRKGWCSDNPVARIRPPRITEQKISILRTEEIRSLLLNASRYRKGICLPAVAIMLYAGIRPNETERLSWEQIDLQNGFITIEPQHSKTGGARRVTIHPPLARLLRLSPQQKGRICPPNWRKHWATLHKLSGWDENKPWQADILRHTFATYHLLYFKSYELLQWETGHRDAAMLRTRYVDMSKADNAHAFWNNDIISSHSQDRANEQ